MLPVWALGLLFNWRVWLIAGVVAWSGYCVKYGINVEKRRVAREIARINAMARDFEAMDAARAKQHEAEVKRSLTAALEEARRDGTACIISPELADRLNRIR